MILQDVWKTQLTFSTHKPIVIEPVRYNRKMCSVKN